jgi:nicotinamidase/pyrazinamidase
MIQKGVFMLEFHNTASFDVDAQKGFTVLCKEELPVEGGEALAEPLNAQAKFAKYRVASKDAHCIDSVWIASDEKPAFSSVGLPNSDIRWNAHCIMGTPGAELIPGMPRLEEYDFFVWKGIEPDYHPYGACFHDLGDKMSTGVIEYLKCQDVENVIVGGLATDYCVKTTAIQLKKAGFRVIVNLEASRGIAKETIESSILEMKNLGIEIISQTQELKNIK